MEGSAAPRLSPSATVAHIARNGLRPDETHLDWQPPAPRAPNRDLGFAALAPSKLSPRARIAARERPFAKRVRVRQRSRVAADRALHDRRTDMRDPDRKQRHRGTM